MIPIKLGKDFIPKKSPKQPTNQIQLRESGSLILGDLGNPGDGSGEWVGIWMNLDVGVSENRGTPKSSILIGFSIINHPFWGTRVPLLLETPM